MIIPATSCKISDCHEQGKLHVNGRRYFIKGYCNKHYLRLTRSHDLHRISNRDPRKSLIDRDIAKIPIGVDAKDGYAIVDLEFAWLDQYKWHTSPHGYAKAEIEGVSKFMHKVILGELPEGMMGDHINRNTLDNRKSNLRVVSALQNVANSGVSSNSFTGYKGVYPERRKGRAPYKSQLYTKGKYIYIGSFKTAEEAARAYDKKALEVNGEYAYLNFPVN